MKLFAKILNGFQLFIIFAESSTSDDCKKQPTEVFSLILHFFEKQALAQMFTFEFCEISNSTFSTEHLWTTVSIVPKH